MNIEEILAKLRAGEKLSKDEIESFTNQLGKYAINGKTSGNMTASEQQALLSEAQSIIAKDPEMQKLQKETIASRKTDRLTRRYAPFFNAIMAGVDLTTSLSQIRQSNNAIANLRRPAYASPTQIDPALNAAIGDAQRGSMDTARAIAPATQQLEDQYVKDLALAKAVGGGQAGTYGAYGQLASLRRARGAGNLLPLADSIRAREQGRLDNLLQMRANQANQGFYQRARNADLAFNQYNQDAAAAGALGAAGRQNLRGSIQSLLNAAPGVAARLPRMYGDKYTQYEQSLNNSLIGRQEKLPNPYSQLTIDDDPSYFLNY